MADGRRIVYWDACVFLSYVNEVADRMPTLEGLLASNRSVAAQLTQQVELLVEDVKNQAAGLGVAFHGKPPARAATPFRVDHGDLPALLYLQGYRQADFVT